jgi:hypothetical protein
MQVNDDLFLGPAVAGGPGMQGATDGPTRQFQGVGPLGRIYVFDVVPVTSGAALLAALQTTVGAGNLVLTAGAGVTTVVVNGQTRLVLDTERRITLTSAGNDSAVNFTISGFDQYGQPMTQLLAGPNANTVSTLKAFKQIVSIAASAAVGVAASAGFSDALGIPVRVTDAGYVLSVKWAGVITQDGGTFVAADVTSPATNATGDVCGVYTPSSAANGARRLVMAFALPAIAVGPQATRVGAFGVNQV